MLGLAQAGDRGQARGGVGWYRPVRRRRLAGRDAGGERGAGALQHASGRPRRRRAAWRGRRGSCWPPPRSWAPMPCPSASLC